MISANLFQIWSTLQAGHKDLPLSQEANINKNIYPP